METWADKRILFYDGDCGFCNRSVQFVLDHEKNTSVHFAALQSDFAQVFFASKGLEKPDLSTLYYWRKDSMYSRSTGALKLAQELKFPYRLLQIGLLIPRFIRDWFYTGVAARRHRLMRGVCALPNPEQKRRFLS